MKKQPSGPGRMRPKVLFVDHSGKPGGGQLGLRRYLEQTSGCEPSLLVVGSGSTFSGLAGAGHRVEQLGLDRPGDSGKALLALGRAIRSIEPDLVVANSTKASAFVAAVPAASFKVLHMRDDLNPERNSRKKLALMRYGILPRFDGFIANSQWTLSTLPASVSARRPTAIAYPVSGVTASQHHPVRTGPPVFLSLSRLDHWKGVHLIVEATEQLIQAGYGGLFKVLIVGSAVHAKPQYEKELRATAAHLGPSIEFLGHQPDVGNLLDRSTSLICASLSPEPFGQVVVQGLSAGCVVIASNAGGPAEILAGDAGLLVEPGSSTALMQAMREVIDAPAIAKEVADRGMSRSHLFSDDRTVTQMDAALAIMATDRRRSDAA